MRFLFLNQTFYPDVVSSAQHLADLATSLAAHGHQVTVLASRRAYDAPGVLFPSRETWKGVRIVRVGSTGFGKRAKWRRVLDFASFGIACAARAVLLRRHDVVVALTSPPLISVLGLGLARLWRARFVYWVMDLNPDEAIAAGWLRRGSASARVLDWLSRLSLQKADRLIALDRFMCTRLWRKGVAHQKISVLPPWSHDAAVRFDAVGRSEFRKRHGLEGKFVVMYSGNHSPCHPLDTVLAAARRFLGQSDIIFCFVGGGSEFRRIRALIATQSFAGDGADRPNILCLPYQPLSKLSASLSAADLHLAILGDPFVGLVHPCKIYNILRIGTPVVYIGPRPSPVSDVLTAANGTMVSGCVGHGDVDGLVGQIERIRKVAPPQAWLQASASSRPSPYAQHELVGQLTRLLEGADDPMCLDGSKLLPEVEHNGIHSGHRRRCGYS